MLAPVGIKRTLAHRNRAEGIHLARRTPLYPLATACAFAQHGHLPILVTRAVRVLFFVFVGYPVAQIV